MTWTPQPDAVPGLKRLAGRFVTMVPLAEPGMAAAMGDSLSQVSPGLWEFMTDPAPSSAKALEDQLTAYNQPAAHQVMGIVDARGDVVGMASYLRIRPEHGSAELGSILFNEALQRTRGATEVISLMAGHMFDELGYRRCEWKTHGLNKRSQDAAIRLGFKAEGVFRQDMWLKGRNRDTYWYSILDTEWPQVKAAFDAWMSDDNVDANGQQIRPLASFRG
ncbi:MAG: GNAT family N-acetyltransferase [Parvularculaceae bacterium]|nr:GNAT family N-acetyltransferase [Parvularculaceae bacterium]